MKDENQEPDDELGDDIVDEEGQEEDQPAEEDAQPDLDSEDGDDDSDDKPSKARLRRERRKAKDQEREAKLALAEERLAAIQRQRELQLKASEGTEEPKEEDFDDPFEYSAARALFRQAKAENARRLQEVDAELEQVTAERQREIDDAFMDQVLDARGRYEDFDTVVSSMPMSEALFNVIKVSDMGADVAYYLGTNAAEAARISRLQPVEAARAIGRIEATLSLPQPRRVSKAPPPVRPVKSSASGQRDPEKMTPAEYRAWRANQG